MTVQRKHALPCATALLLAMGCSTNDSPAPSADPSTSTSNAEATATSLETTSGTTSDADLSTRSSTADDTTSGHAFLTDPDGGPPGIECSIYTQDCPRGEKCNAWANDGGSAWNATKCVPLDPDPDGPGEPCTVTESGVSGLDSCDVGSLCWDFDARTGEGTCLPYCVGDPTALSCQDPNRYCLAGSTGVLSLCFPQCSPLQEGTCPRGLGCYAFGQMGADVFRCGIDDSNGLGGALQPCASGPECAPGLHCGEATEIGACDNGANRCCTPFCDLTDPICPGSTTCVPYFAEGEAAPLHEDLGFCGPEPG